MLNGTFFRNTVAFVAILAVGFLILFGAEYFRAKSAEAPGSFDVESDCITNTGEPC